MNRPQVSDQFGAERLTTQARPIAVTQTTGDGGAWRGLAEVFAQGDLLIEKNRQMQAESDQARAAQYANSMTVAELGKRIKEDKMLASESPVFAATVQHVWGQNSHDAMERDVLGKVTRGELKFNSPEEVDTYLTESRNTTLAGQSKYAVAGFDKGYANLRGKLMDSVAKVNDKEIVEQAANQASDSLGNTLLKVTAEDFSGTPQDAATAILGQYHLLRQTKVMPDAAAKGTLTEVITRAAASGKKDVLDAVLASELPDIGTVRAFIGETKAATLTAQAGAKFDQGQRQRIDDEVLPHMLASDTGSLNVDKFMEWAQSPANKPYVTAPTIHSILSRNAAAQVHQQKELQKARLQGAVLASEYEAQKAVDAALSKGTLWEVQGTNNPKVLTTSGDTKDFNVKDYAEQALKAKTANLPFDQQVSAWAMNGLTNPDWDNQLKAGLNNLASIGVDAKGKPTGQLNEAGQKAIELFRQLDAASPDAAQKTAGGDAYKRFSDIVFLTSMGRAPEDAAAIASSAASGVASGSPADVREKKVAAEVSKLVNTPWLDWLANTRDHALDVVRRNNPVALTGAFAAGVLKEVGVEPPGWLKTDPVGTAMRGTTPNTAQVHGWVKRYATLLAHSGQVGDATEALRLAVEYVGRPEVSARVNGTLYMRSELPAAPSPSRGADEWLGRFIDAVPKAQAKALGFPGEQVRLEFDPRSRVYRAFVAGIPMSDPQGGLMVWQKGAIERWYVQQEAQDLRAAQREAAEAQADRGYAGFSARLGRETAALQKDDQFVMERYDASGGQQILRARILSKEAYRKIVKDGNQDKPLAELMKLYPGTAAKGSSKGP